MKTAPHLVVGSTASLALLAGFFLATEDRALFDARQTQLFTPTDAESRVTPANAFASAKPAAAAVRSRLIAVEDAVPMVASR